MSSILFLGTSSGAGKTTMCAAFCRYLKRRGVRVAPFKGLNLSLNSYVTADGGEIGMGQAFQSWAAGIEPESDMNPVLLKPCGPGRLQAILGGRPFADITGHQPLDRGRAAETVCGSYDRLLSEYDAVVCEGSGSPVELNLIDRDLANVGMMRARRIPSVLVADIERGGVFAAIYGTWLLLPDDVRPLLKGYVINRFRGDASLLESGIARINEMTGMKCYGVMSYEALRFPEEDCLSESDGDIGNGDIHEEFVRNLDRFMEAAEAAGLDFEGLAGLLG